MQLEQYQLKDFELICESGVEAVRAVVEHLRRLDPKPVQLSVLFKAAAEALPENRRAAQALIRESSMAYSWIKQGGLTIEEFQESAREAISEKWSPEEFCKWQEIEPLLAELFNLPVVRHVADAMDLSYEYTNLWRAVRIITDIRPIFDDQAKTIEAAVVSQTFRLRFENVDGRRELHVAMDESDIRDLAGQCERALRKARLACDLMEDKAKVPTMITGEEDDAT